MPQVPYVSRDAQKRRVADFVRRTAEMRGSLAASSTESTQDNGGAVPPAVPGYRLERRLGRGAFAEVWLAEDATGREVALKIGRLGDERRFRREVEALRALRGEHLVPYVDSGVVNDHFWIAMEHVAGPTLAELLEAGPPPKDAAVVLAGEILAGLAELHKQGYVHRDLKPANVLLDSACTVRLADYGLSRAAHSGVSASLASATAEGALVGTPLYMSPEQVEGEGTVGTASDVWSFAVLLYELFTGKAPFWGRTLMSLGKAILADPVELERDDIPSRFRPLLSRCFERDPARRYGDAMEAQRAYEPLSKAELEQHARERVKAAWQRAVDAGIVAVYLRSVAEREVQPDDEELLAGFLRHAAAQGDDVFGDDAFGDEADLDEIREPLHKEYAEVLETTKRRHARQVADTFSAAQKAGLIEWILDEAITAGGEAEPSGEALAATLLGVAQQHDVPPCPQAPLAELMEKVYWHRRKLMHEASTDGEQAYQAAVKDEADWCFATLMDTAGAYITYDFGQTPRAYRDEARARVRHLLGDSAPHLVYKRIVTAIRNAEGKRRLDLVGVRTLGANLIHEIVQWGRGDADWRYLSLADLSRITPEIEQHLFQWGRGDPGPRVLHLDGVRQLDPIFAWHLAQWGHGDSARRELHLNGVQHIYKVEAETAEELAKWGAGEKAERWLHLNGLEGLSPEVARQIATWGKGVDAPRYLSLNGLRHLDTETARELCEWGRGEDALRWLSVRGLRDVNADTLSMLGAWGWQPNRRVILPTKRPWHPREKQEDEHKQSNVRKKADELDASSCSGFVIAFIAIVIVILGTC